MPNLSIIPIPIGSQLVRSIGANDPDDLNDFRCLIVFESNVTNLSESGITLSAGATLVSLEGNNAVGCAVWQATIRPPETATVITVTIAANAVAEGNAETSKDIRVSTSFPDEDAESSITFLTHGIRSPDVGGISVTPTRIFLASSPFNTRITVQKYTHNGTLQTGETLSFTLDRIFEPESIDVINSDILVDGRGFTTRLREKSGGLTLVENNFALSGGGVAHTRLGVTILSNGVSTQQYGQDGVVTHDLENSPSFNIIAHQNDHLYLGHIGNSFGIAEITDAAKINYLTALNIQAANTPHRVEDLAIYKDTLYILTSDEIQTIDLRKYRPLALNTKTTIHPQFVAEGGMLDLTPFSPDAERFVWDVGYDKPDFLTINPNNKLAVASNAVTETTPVLVKLKAINRIDATETDSFEFYLIIEQTADPVWREVDSLTMRANSSYDLFQLVDADEIAFRSGRPRPAGSSLSNGVFRIGRVGGSVAFTATKGSRTETHIAFDVDVVQPLRNRPGSIGESDIFRHRVEIAGIDVSADVREFPTVSKSLDVIELNRYRVDDATLTLSDENGKYNPEIVGNFWSRNNLNPGGFNEPIKIHVESLVDGGWVSSLLFAGNIIEQAESISEIEVKLTCVNIANRLQKTLVSDFGTLEKWDHLRKQSDEDSFEGVYVPEPGLGQMQVGTGAAWRAGGTKLTISRLQLQSEGPPQADTAYMTPSDLRTAGGFLENNPIVQFNAEHRSEDARFLINQLALNKGSHKGSPYNTHIELPEMTLKDPFILNRGSVPFSVEQTRITRLPVDWVYDSSNNRILILLSNPEAHISDLLVQYDLEGDSYRVLHTFEKDIAVHRIARRNASNYYILTSGKITQNRSASQLPRPNDSTGYGYDSVAEESEIKIYHYGLGNPTPTLTEHVDEDDNFPPQLGIHYWVGFENGLNVDAFEGILPDSRGAFKWHSNNLYYRYAKDGEFGVARVNASGTTSEMITQSRDGNWDHLNFAFDVNSSGDIYFVHTAKTSVSSVTVATGNATPGRDLTISDNLSSYSIPSQLNVRWSNTGGRTARRIEITGVDSGGITRTRTINRDTGLIGLSGSIDISTVFSTITRVAVSGFAFGTVTITTIETRVGGLVIRLRDSSGTPETTVFEIYRPLIALTDIDDSGGAYLGALECLFHNNFLYILAPIQRVDYDEDTDENSRAREKSAGMVLYRCNVTAANPSLTVVDTWDFVHQAGCNLVVHEGNVHYVESPPASTKFKPYNPDLETYHTEMGYNILPESVGALKRINYSGEVEELGNLWYEARPYNVAATRCLSFDGDLHLMMGYGNLDEVLRFNSLASAAENVQHLVLGRTLRYVVPTFSAEGSVYEALADLARKLNATLIFNQNLISIQERSPYRAETEGSTGTGTGNIAFKNANKRFPNSGYLRIGKEFVRYTGISGSAFTGIARGTESVSHADGTGIVYIDTIFGKDRLSGNINILQDTTRIHNVIRDSDSSSRFEVRDDESVETFGELPYTLDLGLTRHEKAWTENIFLSYLNELKSSHQLINLRLKPSFFLGLGDFVGGTYAQLIYAGQIVSITYNVDSTQIRLRTL